MPEPINPPNPEILKSINLLLEERGVFVSPDSVEVVVAATSHWLEKSRRGQEYMAYLLQLDAVPGRNENKYLEKDGYGRLTKEIKPESIVFLRGCIVDGKPHPVSQIDISDREVESCDGCGCRTVCTELVETPYGEKRYCSHCAAAEEDPRVRDAIDLKCDVCTYGGCSWHPTNVDAPPFEEYGRGGF